ncbi:MAG: hypothetical protein ABIO85_00715 [Sphingomicrobium sp.]
MRFISTAFGSAVGTALGLALAAATPAAAQTAAAAQPAAKPLKLSPQAMKPIFDLQAAIKAKNSAAIPGLLVAANAAAKVPDDRSAIAQLQLQAAIEANDPNALVAAADALRAAGGTMSASNLANIYIHAGQQLANAQQIGAATGALDKAHAVDPANIDVLLLKSDLLYKQKQFGPSLDALSQAIARKKASGAVIPESWLQAGVARSYEAKLPIAYDMARQWASAYPTAGHWRDAINIYRNMSGLDRVGLIDMFRLARASKSLGGEADYAPFAEALIARGYPGEAVAVMQEGSAAGSISLQSANLARTFALAKGKSIGDRAAATAAARTALGAAGAATTMATADRLLGYGDFAQAATLYRAALGKPGADANLINLRLGEALAQSGDKAGAMVALQAVGGAQSDVAKYWLAWVSSRA